MRWNSQYAVGDIRRQQPCDVSQTTIGRELAASSQAASEIMAAAGALAFAGGISAADKPALSWPSQRIPSLNKSRRRVIN
jgi:hypothetical protein